MGLIELIIVVLVVLWLLGYFGRGRWYATGPATTGTTMAGWAGGSWLHLLIVLAVILLLLRLLNLV
jgi:hypothetical protein